MSEKQEWVCDRCGLTRMGRQSTVTLFRGGPSDEPEPLGKGWIICGSCAEAVEQFMQMAEGEGQS
jgi:hypothetical protein